MRTVFRSIGNIFRKSNDTVAVEPIRNTEKHRSIVNSYKAAIAFYQTFFDTMKRMVSVGR